MACAASSVVAQTQSSTPLRRVLVLYSDERLLPANIIADEAIRATFAAEPATTLSFTANSSTCPDFPGRRSSSVSGIFFGISIRSVRPTW